MSVVPLLEIETPGLLTTVQDLGRPGHQRDGLPVAGAMDSLAAAAANLLVGNPRGAAVLEITLLGPALHVLQDTRISLCGADLSAVVDGRVIPLWKTMRLYRGQRITFGRRRSGARAYLAIAGGFEVPEVLGSRSTFLRARLGGFEGRRLQAGDVLMGNGVHLAAGERGLPFTDVPRYDLPAVLRVLDGPHPGSFAPEALGTLCSSDYLLTPQSDRQGCRLSGPLIPRLGTSEILSEAMPLGGLQVPPDGLPILLMADRQTTGGYPLIAVVISTDMPRAAQLAPGDAVRFTPIGLAEARAEIILLEKRFRLLEYAASI